MIVYLYGMKTLLCCVPVYYGLVLIRFQSNFRKYLTTSTDFATPRGLDTKIILIGNNIQISSSDLLCLTELAKLGSSEVTTFCKSISKKNIFKSPQSCRNAIQKAKKKNLVIKDKKNSCLAALLRLSPDPCGKKYNNWEC